MKILVIVAVTMVTGGGIFAAATYTGMVDWDDYFSDDEHHIDYRFDSAGNTFSVIHTDPGVDSHMEYHAVSKLEIYNRQGMLLIEEGTVTAEAKDGGYIFRNPNEPNRSIFLPDARLEEMTVSVYMDLNRYNRDNGNCLWNKYGLEGGHFWLKPVDEHFELFYAAPDQNFEGAQVIDADYACQPVEVTGSFFVISDTSKVEVQNDGGNKNECEVSIRNATSFLKWGIESGTIMITAGAQS